MPYYSVGNDKSQGFEGISYFYFSGVVFWR